MSVNAEDPSDKGSSGAVPDSAAIHRLIDEAVSKALAQRLPRVKNTEEIIAAKVAEAVARLTPAEKQEQAVQGQPNDQGERPTLKALQEKFDNEMKLIKSRFESEQKARQEAELRARDASLRARVQAEMAKYLPADSPHHAPYMSMLYDMQKRFEEADGNAVIKFKREWGEEPVPLERGVKELFDTELKHLVQQSRAGNLPPGSVGALRGRPMDQPIEGQHRNPLHEVAAAYFAQQGEHNKAAIFAAPPNTNGSNQK